MLVRHERTIDVVKVMYSNKIPAVKQDKDFVWVDVRDSDFLMYMLEMYHKLNWL